MEYIRGCEIEGMLDNEGKVIEEGQGKFLSFALFLFSLFPLCSLPQVRIQNLMLKVIHVRSEFGLILISINKIWRGL